MNSGTTYSAKAATRIAAPTATKTTGNFDFFATGEFFAVFAAFCACPTAAPTAWAAGGVLFLGSLALLLILRARDKKMANA